MTFHKNKIGGDYDYMKLFMKLNGKFSNLFNKREQKNAEIVHPFIYKWDIPWYHWLKMVLVTITILPIKFLGFFITFWIAYLVSSVALWGQTQLQMQDPFTGWRRKVALPLFRGLARVSFWFIGIVWIRVRGEPCLDRTKAPVMVLAPHSAFMDSVFPVWLGMASVVGKLESAHSWIGCLLRMTQPVLVSREDPQSRQRGLNEIIRRTRGSQYWPQMVIFPEGTCTNRSCLIDFKTGAFGPGCPVQPVLIRWPNFPDTVTWTWDGPSLPLLLWMIFSQSYLIAELEFLPVYNPSKEEQDDPKLYASNVRKLMARSLGVPLSSHSYQDCRHMTLARKHGLPFAGVVVEIALVLRSLTEACGGSSEACLDSLEVALRSWHDYQPQYHYQDVSKTAGNHELRQFCYRLRLPGPTNESSLHTALSRLAQFYYKMYPEGSALDSERALLVHLLCLSLPLQRSRALALLLPLFRPDHLEASEDENQLAGAWSQLMEVGFGLTDEESCEFWAEVVRFKADNPGRSYADAVSILMEMVGSPFDMYSLFQSEYATSLRGADRGGSGDISSSPSASSLRQRCTDSATPTNNDNYKAKPS